MTLDAILDRLVVPRPNGSAAIRAAADFLAATAAAHGAAVERDAFTATPHGFALVWIAVLLLALGCALALLRGRHALALLLGLAPGALLLAEFELLLSPISGWWPSTEQNVIATFPGKPGGALLVFAAHYDTTTHFGDHFVWGRWGAAIALGQILSLVVPAIGWLRARRGRALPRGAARVAALLIVVPPAGMLFMQTLGPLLRTASPGALDNAGAVAALLRLADRLEGRSSDSPSTVQLVFLAAEEERALGSWHDAARLARDRSRSVSVVNLELVGASEGLGYIAEDGFAFARYRSPEAMVEKLRAAAAGAGVAPLVEQALPVGSLTDGRSYLAHDLPAVTLTHSGAFPRRLHSYADSRDRVVDAGIERATDLLAALVARTDAAAQGP